MTSTRLAAIFLVPALLGTGCVGVSSTTRTWSEQPAQPAPAVQEQVWYGRVTQVRETIHQYAGDPVAGAFAGAAIGALFGEVLSGGHGGGFYGAMTGAMIGADASRGYGERRLYEITVRYDEGSLRTYVYEGQAPFRVGDDVVLSSRGLAHR
jgi:outer membrane lipoprotein SlyB